MLANAETKWAVLKAVDGLIENIANGRHRETIAAFTGDAECGILGSEVGEAAIGTSALRAFFADIYARPYRVLFTFDQRTISASGNVAWITGEGSYRLSTGGEPKPYRLVGILERRSGQWLWQLFSGSEPVQDPQADG